MFIRTAFQCEVRFLEQVTLLYWLIECASTSNLFNNLFHEAVSISDYILLNFCMVVKMEDQEECNGRNVWRLWGEERCVWGFGGET